MRAGPDPERLEQGEGLRVGRPMRHLADVAQGQGDVVEGRQMGEEVVELKDDAHVAPQRMQPRLAGRRARPQRDAVQIDPALVKPVERDDGPERRGLAAARQPHQRDPLAAADLQVHPAQDRPVAPGQPKAGDGEHRAGQRVAHRCSSRRARRESGSDIAR